MNADEARKISARPNELKDLREKVEKEIRRAAEEGCTSCVYHLGEHTQPWLWPLITFLRVDGFQAMADGSVREPDGEEYIRISISWG